METKSAMGNVAKASRNAILQDALDILEADDGKSFEEKRDAVIKQLTKKDYTELDKILVEKAIADKAGAETKAAFWKYGKVIPVGGEIVLRIVEPEDRDGYLYLQKKYSTLRAMLKEESYCDMVWREHTEDKSLMLSIAKGTEYIGYCGIKDTSLDLWEIAIEMKPEWTHQGIGYAALSAMLKAMKDRTGVTRYRIRIDPSNYVSQRLFEKLGATPFGLSELWIHDPNVLEKCEEDNLHLIDNQLIEVAEKFNVEPRKLLSHILEYRMVWHGDEAKNG